MPEYAKMKNADLEALLKERGLPTGGKKADMVERLTNDDDDKKAKEAAGASAPAASKPAVLHPEDEIDWDDDEDAPATTESAKPASATAIGTTAKPAATDGASGEAQIDPPKTVDLGVKELNEEKEKDGGGKEEEKKQPTPDYTRGVAATNIDEEIAKRKKRAERFGLNIEDDSLKKLERAKKFGEGPPKGLDEALPERTKKRGRDANDEGRRGRDKRRGSGFGGRRGRGDRRRDYRDDRGEDKSRVGGPTWMSEADRAKAEARKGKWSTPAASS